MARWKDQADIDAGECLGDGELDYDDYLDFCLWYEEVTETIAVEEGPYWKIQNSWGEDFGHAGFAYIQHVMPGEHPEFTEGTCQMWRHGTWYVMTSYE